MARDPARIPLVMVKLEQLWQRLPQLRLGQLIMNVRNEIPDLYTIEDAELVAKLEEFYARHVQPEKP